MQLTPKYLQVIPSETQDLPELPLVKEENRRKKKKDRKEGRKEERNEELKKGKMKGKPERTKESRFKHE